MINNDCIFLYIDQLRRDGVGILLIKEYLELLGNKVYIVSYADFFVKYLLYKPKVVLQGNVDIYHGLWTRFISHYSVVCSLPTEQRLTSMKANINRFFIGHAEVGSWPQPYWKGVTKIFINGSALFNELQKKNAFSGNLVPTGYPSIINCKSSDQTIDIKDKLSIGISLEPTFNFRNMAQFIYESNYIELSAYGGLLDYIHFHLKYLKKIFDVIRFISENLPNSKIIVRPRFPDNPDDFHFFKKKHPNISIDKSLFAATFFKKVDCVIVGISNIGIEAQISGVPAISILNLFKENIVPERTRNYWKPNNNDELLSLLKSVLKSDIAVSPDMVGFNRFVADYYGPSQNFNSPFPPARLIAENLNLLMRSNIANIKFGQKEFTFSDFIKLLPPKIRNIRMAKIIFNEGIFSKLILHLYIIILKMKGLFSKNEYGRSYFYNKNIAQKEFDLLLKESSLLSKFN